MFEAFQTVAQFTVFGREFLQIFAQLLDLIVAAFAFADSEQRFAAETDFAPFDSGFDPALQARHRFFITEGLEGADSRQARAPAFVIQQIVQAVANLLLLFVLDYLT